MNALISASVLCAILSVCSAHLCLISPHQRGSMNNINKPGTDDCFLIKPPCGGRPAETPQTVWKSGGNYSVVFQKNLDHWVAATPGHFSVSFITGHEAIKLADIPDNGEKSLHLYTANITVPEFDQSVGQGSLAVLEVTYVTMNPKAPPVFHQCADVFIM